MKAVDLFAGYGGFTEGATKAGVRVVWAANHNPLAIRAHAMNNPKTKHSCQDLQQADFTQLPRFDLLLAAPACQGHSEAGQVRRTGNGFLSMKHDAMRSTAWAIVACADVCEPKMLIVENIVQFKRWRLYPAWTSTLKELGYHLTEFIVRASHHGVPQRRDRLFVVGTKKAVELGALQENLVEPAFGPCIEWDQGRWRLVKSAQAGARARLEAARREVGPRAIVQHVTGHRGLSLDEPVRTITTKDQWHVLDGDYYRPFTIRETARAMGFRDSFEVPEDATRKEAVMGFGNAICPPVATAIVEHVVERAA